MPDFTFTQTVIAVLIILFFILFYLRRSWFWFWKVTKLFKQFEDLERITFATNREVKELNRKLTELITLLNEKSKLISLIKNPEIRERIERVDRNEGLERVMIEVD